MIKIYKIFIGPNKKASLKNNVTQEILKSIKILLKNYVIIIIKKIHDRNFTKFSQH